jgi:hypothetical protein
LGSGAVEFRGNADLLPKSISWILSNFWSNGESLNDDSLAHVKS